MKYLPLLLLLFACSTEKKAEEAMYECTVRTEKGIFRVTPKSPMTKAKKDLLIADVANKIHEDMLVDEVIYECHIVE